MEAMNGCRLAWTSIPIHLALAVAAAASSGPGGNCLPNPGFESVAGVRPSGWVTNGPSRFYATTDADEGRYAAVVEFSAGTAGGSTKARGGIRCAAALRPGHWVLRGRVKGQNITRTIPVCVFARGGSRGETQVAMPLPGTFGWRSFRIPLDIPADADGTNSMFVLWFFGPQDRACRAVVDDLALEPSAIAHNLIRNGGFEIVSVPRVPDFWRNSVRALHDPAVADALAVDDDAAAGRRSLRLSFDTPALDGFARRRNSASAIYMLQQPGRIHTISAWLKSEPPGLPVEVALDHGPRQTFRPDATWQRHAFDAICGTETGGTARGSISFTVGSSDSIGKPMAARVWIDNVRMAAEDTGTAWAAAPEDAAWVGRGPVRFAVAAPPRGPLKAARAGEPPRIDGILDESCWREAAVADGFIVPGGATTASVPTAARLAFDDAALYVAFTAWGPTTPQRPATAAEDRSMFGDDTVGLFLDASGTGAARHRWVWNSGGAVYDERIESEPGVDSAPDEVGETVDSNWDSGVESAARPCPGGWTLEARIPLHALQSASFDPGRALVNFSRENPAANEISCWSAAAGRFHRRDAFAPLAGWMPDMRAFKVDIGTPRFWRDGSGPALRGALRIAGGAAAVHCEVAHIGAVETAIATGIPGPHVAFRIPVELAGRGAACRIRVRAPGQGGRLLAERVFPVMEEPVWDFACGSLVFAEEGRIPVIATVRLPECDAAGLRLNLTLRPGSPPGTAALPTPGCGYPAAAGRNEIAFPLSNAPAGPCTLVGELVDASGSILAVAERPVEIRASRPSFVRFDPRWSGFERDGRPWVPVAIGFARTQDLAGVRSHGFNAVWYAPPVGEAPAPAGGFGGFLDAATAAGMAVVVDYGPYVRTAWRQNTPFGTIRDAVRGLVESCRAHPAVAFHHIADEPEVQHGPVDRTSGPFADIVRLHAMVRDLDPYHPVFVNWGPSVAAWRDLSFTDLMAYDYYSTALSPVERSFERHVDFDRHALRRARETGKPFLKWVEFDHSCTELGDRLMRPAELRCVAYLSLIGGARALSYYYYRPWNDDAWEEMARIGAEISSLTPSLALADSRAEAVCDDPAIRLLVKAGPGVVRLIAANSSVRGRIAKIRLVRAGPDPSPGPLFARLPSVKESFGRPPGGYHDGCLVIPFEGYGVRALELSPAP
jgi:hypothetical protein